MEGHESCLFWDGSRKKNLKCWKAAVFVFFEL